MTNPGENPLLRKLHFQLTVTRAMLGTLELDQILYIILSGITHGDGLGFNRAFLFLADDSARELRAHSGVGPADEAEAHRIWEAMVAEKLDLPQLLEAFEAAGKDPRARALSQRLAGFVVPLSAAAPPILEGDNNVPVQALIARCAALKGPFYYNTVTALFQPPPAGGGDVLTFSQLAVVPLLQKETVLGVILADNAYNHRQVREEEMEGLVTLGNLAAIAIEKAHLHQRIKEMAALDGLTGVFNRRHYELRLQQEVARAARAGRPISMLLFDIDHFKECNDSSGHEAGDHVLKDLAALLRDRVRTEDLVARYGGEEFVVLLTGGATPEEALRVAEKLRAEVAARPLGGQPAGRITVSVGLASLPPDHLDGAELFRLADRALYRAKAAGRNRVIPADG